MEVKLSFEQLKSLVTIVADDLLNDDFSNLLCESDYQSNSSLSSDPRHDVSEEIYDKIELLGTLLNNLSKYRCLPF